MLISNLLKDETKTNNVFCTYLLILNGKRF